MILHHATGTVPKVIMVCDIILITVFNHAMSTGLLWSMLYHSEHLTVIYSVSDAILIYLSKILLLLILVWYTAVIGFSKITFSRNGLSMRKLTVKNTAQQR